MIPPLTEGQQTTLTCTAPGLCSGSAPKITWTWRRAGENDSHITGNITAVKTDNVAAVTQRHSSTLTFNLSAEHHGTEVTCKVGFTGSTTTEETVTLNVTWFPKILNKSGCELQSEVLTCVCISQGIPLPTIRWPLLENHTEYSVTATVSKHTVNSTITLSVKDHSSTVVECVSSNDMGEAKEKLTVIINQEDLLKKLLITVQQPEVIVSFFTGILVSAAICCLARKCHRKNQDISDDTAEILEVVTTEAVQLVVAGHVEENERSHDQETAERGAGAAGPSTADGDVDPIEVEYSHIHFSMLKSKRPTEAEGTKESTETEYAEIKAGKTVERQDNEDEEEEVMRGEDQETKECLSAEEEESEDMVVYSNVKEIMAEV
ncbi:sialic acid-binding Ig-like lectin 9 [Pempheris klunzingeri]|uniref:sialic acid-binding Ig-like lectin 9 n=1 Tax=Pempheris klunzingeri TaxID=3127111 RepID=UPI003980C22A